MNPLATAGLIISGVTIVTLAHKLQKKNKALKSVAKSAQTLLTINDLYKRIIQTQNANLGDADIMVPSQLVTDMDAFVIMNQNDML